MKIELTNEDLPNAIHFMSETVPLKGKDSRYRSKFVKLLKKAADEYAADELELARNNNLLDEYDELLPGEKQNKADVKAFNKDVKELREEKIVIEGGMYANNIAEIPRILNEYEGKMTGAEAEIYDMLLDEFEKGDNQ